MDISGFRQDPQVSRIRGENIVAVGGQAYHGGALLRRAVSVFSAMMSAM